MAKKSGGGRKAWRLIGVGVLVAGLVAPASAAEAPRLSFAFRAAAHADFDRVVLDVPKGVAYRLERQGDTVRLVFDRAADVRVSGKGLGRVAGLRAGVENDVLVVQFAVAGKAILKDFRSGPSVVVDIFGPAAPSTAQPASRPEATASASVQPEPPKPASVAAPVAREAAAKPEPSQGETRKPAPLKVDTPKADAASKEAPVAEPAARPVAKAAVASNEKLVLGDQPVLVASLDPKIPTGAVIYARGGVATLVFDRKLTLDPTVLAAGTPLRVTLDPVDFARNSGFRFVLPPGATLRATREGTAWQIFLARQKPDLAVSTDLVADPDFALGARLLLPTAAPPDPVRIVDPLIGDSLILVPLRETTAFPQMRRLADLTLLPTAQGLVIKPEHERVTVRVVSDGVEISSEGGLHLSSSRDRGSVASVSGKDKISPAQRLFALDQWRGRLGATFTETRQLLMQTIVDVPEPQKPLARLELARFYFAHGLSEEAIALLGLLEKQIPDLANHPDYLALRGAAHALSGDNQEALTDLSDSRLAGLPEIDLWQGVAAANERNWEYAERKFALGHAVLAAYPEPIYSRLMVLAVETAVAAGKDAEAADWLHELESKSSDDSIHPAITYLRGALAVRAGRAEEAGQLWREVDKSEDRLYKVRAELGLIDLGIATHSLTPLQAVEKLEGLRFAWRGDELEVEILHRLGEFYFDAQNYKAGLATMQQALRYYAGSPAIEPLKTEMKKVFRDLFLTPKGKDFSPIEALALYQEYKDLRPAGDEGTQLQLALAEKLVSIDLLDQASAIYTDLIKNTLKGDAKAKTGTRLAAIRLLDHKPDLALAALDQSQIDTMPAAMQDERLVLRARALAESKKYDDALALLQNKDTVVAQKLRADILMKAKRWKEAAQALLDLVGPPPAAGAALPKDKTDLMLLCAIASAVGGDIPMLDKLAIDYSAAMAGAPQEDTFRVLTRPDKTLQARDITAAQSRLSEVDIFRGFLDSYRKGDK
jgi:hypothetical protein